MTGGLSHCVSEARIHLPSIKSELGENDEWTPVEKTLNVKRALSKIFS
jgi:hypothetical protein